MKKKILSLMLCITLACSLLAGCGSSPSKIYEAYKEFYREFYNEHIEKGSEYAVMDCGGQIVFDEEDNPLLAICDLSASSEAGMADIYIYGYEGGEVKELARKTGLVMEDGGVSISNVDGAITIYAPEADSDESITAYVLSEYGFEKESFADIGLDVEADFGELDAETVFGDLDAEQKHKLYTMLFSMSGDELYSMFFDTSEEGGNAINGSNFEMLLSQLAEAKPGTGLELKLVYTDFFKRAGIYGEPEFTYVEDEKVYIYNSSDNKFCYFGNFGMLDFIFDMYYSMIDSGTADMTLDGLIETGVLENVPDKIEDIEVELSGFLKGFLLNAMAPDDLEEFEYFEDKLSIKAEHNLSFEIPTVHTDSDGNTIDAGWMMRIITGGNETDGYEYTYIESSYDEVKKYMDAGLATDIIIDSGTQTDTSTEIYITGVMITLADTDSYVSLMDEEKRQAYIVENEVIPAFEAYVSENFGNGSYDVYNFIYIDDDNIPELLFDNSADGRGTEVLCYRNGEVYASSAWCRGFEFYYIPKGNKVIYSGVWLGDESGSVAHLENGLLIEEHSYYFDFNDVTGEGGTYQIDGVQCLETEYNNFMETYFKYDDAEYGWETYSSIQEAYENIGKITFTEDEGHITKFEMTDNVLTVETESGESISYPVADNCTWENTSYGEVFGTYTYEELKAEIEGERDRYLSYPEFYESPIVLYLEIRDDVIVKIFTSRP